MEVTDEIGSAISEAVRAGVFRRAGRLNPRHREIYDRMAAGHSKEAGRHLDAMLRRLGTGACREEG